ncbi:MAG: type III pantothenate kinase [Candidatus Omnitrophota bacterium]|nr:type III pantothenate kinase [Candidatus Omnitrophota bacterium]
MLLAVDIGNTNITFGIFKGKKLQKQFDIPTKEYSKFKLLKKLRIKPRISATLICSVVPKLTRILQRDLMIKTGKKPYILGKDLVVPINNPYHKPNQLGQDRLVNTYAALCFYKTPLIVIDSGTAITFDVIDKNKKYLGGLIIPGMKISLEALREKTALLPSVSLNNPKMFIGCDTKNSLLSGIVFGTAGSVKELTNKIKKCIGKNARVIGTGGNIGLIKKYSKIDLKTDNNLTLKGINFIYEETI